MMIRKAEMKDLSAVTQLARCLWPHHGAQEMEELASIMAQANAAFFLAFDGGKAIGFAQCQLRWDYVEGTESSPVGYLEGIYVAEGCRKQGIARQLLAACENWAKSCGCAEFASWTIPKASNSICIWALRRLIALFILRRSCKE